MTKEVATAQPEMDIHALAQLFVQKDISGAPVVNGSGKLLGVVLEEDLILQDKKVHLPTLIAILNGVFALGEEKFEKEMRKMGAITVAGIMQEKVTVLSPETPVEDVATMMIEKGIHYFPVTDNGCLVGVVTKKDIVRAIAQKKIW
jgi:CBS domain-containing protein